MTFEESKKIFDSINSTSLTKLKIDLIEAAFRYARIRADWYLMEDDERNDNDEARTIAHNAFIDSCNILSREMLKINENADWRLQVGNDRRVIGDFACYLLTIIGLAMR